MSCDCHVILFFLKDETEWQSFLRKSLEFVGKVAELFPTETFQMIVSHFAISEIILSLSLSLSHRFLY